MSSIARMTLILCAVFLAICLPFPSAAQVFKYQDERGHWHFTDKPPQDKDSDEVGVISSQKHVALGTFEFDSRFRTYKSLDRIANRLNESPIREVVKKIWPDSKEIGFFELRDCDSDGQPDEFIFNPTEGENSQDFGFMFDLNKDRRVDYLVFNGGPMINKEGQSYWMNYHWIDSNYDNRIDIMVNNAIDIDFDNLPDTGVTAWLYDSDFDEYPDRAEYLIEGMTKPVRGKHGKLTVNWFLKDMTITIGKDHSMGSMSKILAIINDAMH